MKGSDIEVIDQDELTCGCVVGRAIVDGKKTTFYNPCSETCEYFAFAIEEARKLGTPIDFKEGEL